MNLAEFKLKSFIPKFKMNLKLKILEKISVKKTCYFLGKNINEDYLLDWEIK